MYVYIYLYTYVCVYIYSIYIYILIYWYVYICIDIYIYICIYMYMYMCMWMCIYTCKYICTFFVPLKKLLRRSLPSPTHMNPSLDNDMAMKCQPWLVAKAALRNALYTIHTALMPSQGKVTIAWATCQVAESHSLTTSGYVWLYFNNVLLPACTTRNSPNLDGAI